LADLINNLNSNHNFYLVGSPQNEDNYQLAIFLASQIDSPE